jgi:hypothetical protein
MAMVVRVLSVVVVAMCGCDGGDGVAPAGSPPPAGPASAPGRAVVQGRVLGADGQPVAGATVAVLDAPVGAAAGASAGADGRWQLSVPADTSITLRATAEGLAPTLFGAFLVPDGRVTEDLDLLLLTRQTVDQMNAAAGGADGTALGVAALDIVARGGCDAAGGQVSLDPARAGQVAYGAGAAVAPDGAATAVQAGARPAVWLLGVRPPGVYYHIRFDKPGCRQSAGPVEWGGRIHQGGPPFAAGSLSQGLLFVE